MLILTSNQCLKCGLGVIIEVCGNNINDQIMIFDADNYIYLFREIREEFYSAPNFYKVLTSGERLKKEDIKKSDHYIQYLMEDVSNNLQLPGEQPEELTICERVVIETILSGYSCSEIAMLLNISLKTLTCHKKML